MAYSDFTFDNLKTTFGLELEERKDLFATIEGIKPTETLAEVLKTNIPLALAIHTEKARSELIVTPILVEIYKYSDGQVSLFSGVEFNADSDRGLDGPCDFIISRSKDQLFISAPTILVEGAKNDIKECLIKCIAEMLGAKVFNEQKGNDIPVIYGIVTTGSLWKFLTLTDQTLCIDRVEYHVKEIDKILGILIHMVS